MKHPDQDIWLSDGMSYMVQWEPYKHHLDSSTDAHEVCLTPSSDTLQTNDGIQQRATCANHKAVNQANSERRNLEATGIGACACARHGCFVPHSVVDFQKGERFVHLIC